MAIITSFNWFTCNTTGVYSILKEVRLQITGLVQFRYVHENFWPLPDCNIRAPVLLSRPWLVIFGKLGLIWVTQAYEVILYRQQLLCSTFWFAVIVPNIKWCSFVTLVESIFSVYLFLFFMYFAIITFFFRITLTR